MTTAKEASLELTLTDGVTETTTEDNAGGIITVSQNTRLTKLKGTLSRCPETAPINSNAALCGGLVLGGRDNVCAYFEAGAHQRISGTSPTPVIGAVTGTPGANAYYPYPLVDSGAIGGGADGLAPATCFDSANRQWFVGTQYIVGTAPGTSDIGIFVNVIADGDDVVTPIMVVRLNNSLGLWTGVTPCTGGVVIWYQSGYHVAGYADISAIRLSISGAALVIGSPSLVYSPQKPAPFLQADIVSNGSNTAYLLSRDAVTNTSVVLLKIDLTTLAVTATATFPSVVAFTAPTVFFAVSLMSSGGVDYVAVATSEGAGVTLKAVCNAITLGVVWSLTGTGRYGAVSVLPWFVGSKKYVVFANALTGTAIGTNASAVIFDTYDLATGQFIDEAYAYWYGLQSKGASHSPQGSADAYPYFPLFGRWGAPGAAPSQKGGNPTMYFESASCEVVTMFSPTVVTPVMRFGVDRVSQYSAQLYGSPLAAVSADGKICFSYTADRYDQPSGANQFFASRYVVFDLEPSIQPGTAADEGNVAIIASGLPAVWDGTETTEYCPFHRPKIAVNFFGGTGPHLTGIINYTAVVSWRDGCGNVRRSAPALPVQVTQDSTAAKIFVTMPLTMRNGQTQEWYDIVLYGTIADINTPGSVFIALNATAITRGQIGCWQFDYVPAAVPGDITLYTQFEGIQPLEPECPPPIWDARSIAGRIWVIDAEDRYRLLPSKLKEPGIAYEFNSNLEVRGFDQQYGKLQAVAEVGGSPVAFAERGLWQVDGFGPDNSGQGNTFQPPRLISNMGCRARHTVCQVPGVGVMFQANDGHFCLLAGGFKRFETFGVYDVQAPTIHLLQNEVIYPLTDGTGHVVYNWLADGWTHWVNPTPVVPTMIATLQTGGQSRTYQALLSGGTCQLVHLDSDNASSSATHPIQAVRGWVAPESTQGDCVNRDVWLQSLYAGPHGIRVRVAFDYNETKFVEREWSPAEILKLVRNGRYTVGIDCHASQARAFKVTVTEIAAGGSGDAFQPMVLTVIYGVSPGFRAISQLEGAKK